MLSCIRDTNSPIHALGQVVSYAKVITVLAFLISSVWVKKPLLVVNVKIFTYVNGCWGMQSLSSIFSAILSNLIIPSSWGRWRWACCEWWLPKTYTNGNSWSLFWVWRKGITSMIYNTSSYPCIFKESSLSVGTSNRGLWSLGTEQIVKSCKVLKRDSFEDILVALSISRNIRSCLTF